MRATKVWKCIKGYEGYYEVSNYGDVRSLDREVKVKGGYRVCKGKTLSPSFDHDGYAKFNLYKEGNYKTYKRSRLVAENHLDNPKNLPVVEHRDDNKVNDYVGNLKWGTVSSNTQAAHDTGRIVVPKGKDNIKFKGGVKAYLNGEEMFYFEGRKEMEKAGFNGGAIYNVLNGRAKTHKGYSFERVNFK